MTLQLAADLQELPSWVEDLVRPAIIAVVLLGLLVTFSSKRSKGKDDD